MAAASASVSAVGTWTLEVEGLAGEAAYTWLSLSLDVYVILQS